MAFDAVYLALGVEILGKWKRQVIAIIGLPLAALVGVSFAAMAWLLAQVGTLDPAGAGLAPAAKQIAAEGPPQGSLAQVGRSLFGPFALPFEMASLVLLAAIVGAVVLARGRAARS